MNYYTSLLFVTIFTSPTVHGSRILGVFPCPSISHQTFFRTLMMELHSRGHQIVTMTTDPVRNSTMTNYTEVDLSVMYDYFRKNFDFTTSRERNNGYSISYLLQASVNGCRFLFESPELKNFSMQTTQKFDLVIAEWILAPCIYGYAHKYSAPLIGISSAGLHPSGHDSVGNPSHPAYIPDMFSSHSDHTTFWERICGVLYFVWFRWLWHTYLLPNHDVISKEFFGNSTPYIGDIERNVSLVFSNYQSKVFYIRPNVPAVIELGDMHFKEVSPLPTDLQEFLDGAPEGAIYFSLGTTIRCDRLSHDKLQILLDAFSELSQFRVLWKWERDELPGQPSNVRMAKWFPQQDVLSHRKIKVFIYQGGLHSTEEAIRFHVPVIGIPFYADQEVNVRKIVDSGAGLRIDINNLSKETLLNYVNKTIHDGRYKQNMRKLYERMKDQPETSLQRAVWWIEYVIRHKGARHLRSAALDLTWYQYLLLDVMAFIIVTSVATVWLLYVITSVIARRVKSCMNPRPKID